MAAKTGTTERPKISVKKGDNVRVLAGKDKGKQGKVLEVLYKTSRVVVENINIAKKAVKADPRKNPQGGIISMPAPLDVSNVMVVCPQCNKPSRLTRHRDTEGKSSRKCRKCGELIDA